MKTIKCDTVDKNIELREEIFIISPLWREISSSVEALRRRRRFKAFSLTAQTWAAVQPTLCSPLRFGAAFISYFKYNCLLYDMLKKNSLLENVQKVRREKWRNPGADRSRYRGETKWRTWRNRPSETNSEQRRSSWWQFFIPDPPCVQWGAE